MPMDPVSWVLGEAKPQTLRGLGAHCWTGPESQQGEGDGEAQQGEDGTLAWVCGHSLLVQAEGEMGVVQEG